MMIRAIHMEKLGRERVKRVLGAVAVLHSQGKLPMKMNLSKRPKGNEGVSYADGYLDREELADANTKNRELAGVFEEDQGILTAVE